MFQSAQVEYQSGQFLLQRLSAERLLEPELDGYPRSAPSRALAGIEQPTAADIMSADIAIIAYRNLLRVQGWIGSL